MMMGMDASPPIGLKIKRARERLRWSQAQLAAAIGVSQKTIDNWEHDKRYPKSAIGALEEILGVRFDDEPEPAPAPRPSRSAEEALDRAQAELDELRALLRSQGKEGNGDEGNGTRRAG